MKKSKKLDINDQNWMNGFPPIRMSDNQEAKKEIGKGVAEDNKGIYTVPETIRRNNQLAIMALTIF